MNLKEPNLEIAIPKGLDKTAALKEEPKSYQQAIRLLYLCTANPKKPYFKALEIVAGHRDGVNEQDLFGELTFKGFKRPLETILDLVKNEILVSNQEDVTDISQIIISFAPEYADIINLIYNIVLSEK